MKTKPNITVPYIDVRALLDAIEVVEAELEQIAFDNDWFVSDSTDHVQVAKQILHGLLGIKEYNDDELDD